MKKYLLLLLLLALIGGRLYFRLTDDFRLANIQYEVPYRAEWDIPPPLPDLKTLLSQSFSYIGKGSQSYAFASSDGQYVLKFFKFKHLKPHWLVEVLSPLPFFNVYERKQLKRKNRKLNSLFNGYRLAWEQLRDESGLFFIHLNKTQGLYPTATVLDKIGLKRSIDLDSVVFIIQAKARTTRAVIDELLTKGDVATAQLRLRQILALYASEYRRGLYDMDHGVMHNTGFVGAQPIHLDVGKLTREDRTHAPAFYQPDIQLVATRITAWLQINHPAHYAAMLYDFDNALQEQFFTTEKL